MNLAVGWGQRRVGERLDGLRGAVETDTLRCFCVRVGASLNPRSGRLLMAKFVVYADAGGKYRWKLVASNGQTTASAGESFSSKASARKAAESVKKSAASAEVVEE